MLARLPGWVISEAESVRRKAARYAGMTPEQRAEHLSAAVRVGASLLAARTDRDRVRAWSDPLPASTVRALDRLRREARDRRAAR